MSEYIETRPKCSGTQYKYHRDIRDLLYLYGIYLYSLTGSYVVLPKMELGGTFFTAGV